MLEMVNFTSYCLTRRALSLTTVFRLLLVYWVCLERVKLVNYIFSVLWNEGLLSCLNLDRCCEESMCSLLVTMEESLSLFPTGVSPRPYGKL